MKKLAYILTILILGFSCDLKKSDGSLETLIYTDNELFLLQSGDTIPKTNIKLFEFRDSFEVKLSKYFIEYECRQTKFKIQYEIDSNQFVPIAIHTHNYMNCELTPPPFNPFVDWMHVYLTKEDTLYVRRDVYPIDSVSNKVLQRYNEIPFKRWHRVYFALFWDNQANNERFSSLIKKIIEGYLIVVDSKCLEIYNKGLNELKEDELAVIAKQIPFQLRTDFHFEYDTMDFVPSHHSAAVKLMPVENHDEIFKMIENQIKK